MSVATQQDTPGLPPAAFGANNAGLTRAAGPGLWLMLAYLPLLLLFFISLWGRPHYQFFPLALGGALFLGWTRLKEVPRPFVEGHWLVTALLLGLSFFLLAAATFFWSPWIGSTAAMAGLVAVIWWRGGKPLLLAMLPALLLVITVIPPPLAGDIRLIQHMRVLAVRWSSVVLDALGVTHALSGNVIELPRQQLLVDEACSGINSVLITLAASLFFTLWQRRGVVHTILCLCSALSFVLLGNLVRITVGGWLKFRYGIDILYGTPHEIIGLVLFASYLALILSTDQLLLFLMSPTRSPQPTPATTANTELQPPATPARGLPRSFARAAVVVFLCLGVVDLGIAAMRQTRPRQQVAVVPKSGLRSGATFAMPENIGNWKRMSTEVPPLQKIETRGVYSQVWNYQQGETVASVALDYPFQGYHDVTICYSLRGWDVLEQKSIMPKGTNAVPPYAEARMQNNVGLHGALWFSIVDERGRWLPGPHLNRSIKERILDRFKLESLNRSVTYQVQVLSTGFNAMRPAEREQARQLFEQGRMVLWREISSQLHGKK